MATILCLDVVVPSKNSKLSHQATYLASMRVLSGKSTSISNSLVNCLTTKTSPFIRISFNFSLSFLSSSACFLVRYGEIKVSAISLPSAPLLPQSTGSTHHLILLLKAKFLHNHSYLLIHILTLLDIDTPYDNHVLSLLDIQCLCNFLFQWYG